MSRARAYAVGLVAASLFAVPLEREAHAQACCVGASGLTPGWLANHERALVGLQTRGSQTIGTYPTSGTFYVPTRARDTRLDTSLFASLRLTSRGQIGMVAPLVLTRRRLDGLVETRAAPGDVALSGRYDFVRAGESRVPGLVALVGVSAPTGTPPDRGTGLLAADVTGTGAWEVSVGGSVEQTFGRFITHATALVGLRAPRDVLGLPQQLGLRGLFLAAAGYVFDGEVAMLVSVTHQSEGDATVGGDVAPGTGARTTQGALLVVAPLSDTLRLRSSVFADVPPLGENRPAAAGATIALLRSWM